MAKNNKTSFPANQRNPQNNTISIEESLIAEQFEGPLPHPSILANYNSIQKGFADRIVSSFEKETNHRHEMDKKLLDSAIQAQKYEATEARLGQIFALLIGLSAIFAGSYTAIKGFPIPGTFIGTTGVAGLVSVFILGRNNQNNDNNETKDIVPTQENTNSE